MQKRCLAVITKSRVEAAQRRFWIFFEMTIFLLRNLIYFIYERFMERVLNKFTLNFV